MAVDEDRDVGANGLSDGLDSFESSFGAVGESDGFEWRSALVEGSAFDRRETVVYGFDGHFGEVVGSAVDGALVVGK